MLGRKIWVVGHKNPDTDSICAAIAYANLKNILARRSEISNDEYIPSRAGEINAETAYVLSRFGVQEPEYISDVGTQLKDIPYRRTEGVSNQLSLKKAWELMKTLDVVTLPVVNAANNLEGIVVTGDIAESYMDAYDNTVLSEAKTQYKNIADTLDGKIVTGNEHGYFVRGKVMAAVGSSEVTRSILEKDDLVIVGDHEEVQLIAIEEGCSCIVVSDNLEVSENVIEAALKHQVVIITSPYDTYTISRLINQSMPLKYIMTTENIVSFELDDFVDEVREITAKIRHRDFPILDEQQNYVGMFSRRYLLNAQKKQLILVDHNEKSQAVNNVADAEILEIIDHHRLGSLETMAPVMFRNQPLGSTSTIVYQMYREKYVEITKEIAGILCAAIISDTLMFRSPTCTETDEIAANDLAGIAGIEIEELAHKMFEAGSDFENKTEKEILNQDFKIFYMGSISFGVSQVSAMGQLALERVRERIEKKIPPMCQEKGVQMMYVMLTDIVTEKTLLLYTGSGAETIAEEAFTIKPKNGVFELLGVVSRKKQLIPALMNALYERMF